MKVIILCGGQGTRLREETEYRPKPLVDIGGRPILWHIMRWYASHGFKDFILCLGYKGWLIKEYFLNYKAYNSDFTLQLGFDKAIEYHYRGNGRYWTSDDWRITFVETGLETLTGARVKQTAPYLPDDDFMLTYGDGLADVNIRALVDYHRAHGKIGTVTSVSAPGRFGELDITSDGAVRGFSEKPTGTPTISGGFFVFQRRFLDYLSDHKDCSMERGPLERLSADGQLVAFQHTGFWQAMDTYREFVALNDLWNSGNAPWKPAERKP